MKSTIASISTLFGVIAAILVFTPYFKTPPIPIVLFAILGIVLSVVSLKEAKALSLIGMILSIVSLGYLIFLYIQLGG